MRIGLFADLHANREALEACLADARRLGVSQQVFLGDLVGYGADPIWVVERVMAEQARGALVLRGNHDEAIEREHAAMHEEVRQSLTWTGLQLDPQQRAFLAGLPLSIEAEDRLYVHANAFAPGNWAYLLDRIGVSRSLAATRARLSFVGHVHEPMLYSDAGRGRLVAFQPYPGSPIPLTAHRRWLAIVGSVGQPRDGNPAACWAMFDTDSLAMTFLRVPYDHLAAAAKVRAAGLPERFAARLESGY